MSEMSSTSRRASETEEAQLLSYIHCENASAAVMGVDRFVGVMSASLIGRSGSSAFRLSTSTVSISLAGSRFSSESALGPSIMGYEDEAEQSLPRPCRLTDSRSKRTCELASTIVPQGTSFHRSVELERAPILFDLRGSYAAAVSRVHRNSVPSTQMRCRITASRRASATTTFLIPRCLAIFMAHALSHDHFARRTSMIWAAS
jgi:hypothetical protein